MGDHAVLALPLSRRSLYAVLPLPLLSSPLVGLAGADLSRALHLSALHLSLRTCFSFFRHHPRPNVCASQPRSSSHDPSSSFSTTFRLERVTADQVPARTNTSQPSPSSPPPALCSS